jgi:hypothetical protein
MGINFAREGPIDELVPHAGALRINRDQMRCAAQASRHEDSLSSPATRSGCRD